MISAARSVEDQQVATVKDFGVVDAGEAQFLDIGVAHRARVAGVQRQRLRLRQFVANEGEAAGVIQVVAGSAVKQPRVCACPRGVHRQDVVARPAVDAVIPRTGGEGVVTRPAYYEVIASDL